MVSESVCEVVGNAIQFMAWKLGPQFSSQLKSAKNLKRREGDPIKRGCFKKDRYIERTIVAQDEVR